MAHLNVTNRPNICSNERERFRKFRQVVATLKPSTLPFAFRDYASQLDEIHSSLSAMAKEAGEYKDIASRMATNVHSASSVLRAASHVINSRESHKEHEADKAERALAKARRAGHYSQWTKIQNG